ncbi:MAG: hypothetical protein RML46_12750 [Anaerolineae bacterium]|nr:hypothetical protein [Anaerolineae bacterium]
MMVVDRPITCPSCRTTFYLTTDGILAELADEWGYTHDELFFDLYCPRCKAALNAKTEAEQGQ